MNDTEDTDERSDREDDADTEVLLARVGAELAGERCDRVAAVLFPDYSRARLKQWLEAGRLTVDGASPRPRDPVAADALFELLPEQHSEVGWGPQPMTLALLHEDADVIVVDKPAGLITHPGAGVPDGTLINGLLARFPELEQLPRGGIVHRLDKDTSGVMMVARSLVAHGRLVSMLATRTVSRRYLAVCEGVPTGGFRVDAAIGRDRARRTRMAVRGDGKPAVTHVRVLDRFAAHAALDVRLETGRTHQIRVHAAYRGFPLVGDVLYGARRRLPPAPGPVLTELLRGFPRQALHARRLAFDHPVSGRALRFDAPVPADLQALLDALGEHAETIGSA